MSSGTGHRSATVATEASAAGPRQAALVLCLMATVTTGGLMTIAARPGPVLPGFILIDQTALISAYGLSAWVLFAQFFRSRSLPLLLIAAGTLYTVAIVMLQLLSFPVLLGGARILGAGPETTTWLWMFWHLGPPVCAMAYALTLRGEPVVVGRRAAAVAALIALSAAGLTALACTAGLPWLPHQVTGDDYSDVTRSGVGLGLQLVTAAALALVWRMTRQRRTVLELWIGVSLFLLILDNCLTLAGGARGSIGWYGGRIEAVVSAFVILRAYLHEVDALRARAEAAVEDVARVEASLRQVQKMEAIGRLTGGVAHDFNNLLMVMTSAFDMIRRRPDDRQRVLRMSAAGMDAAERGARLTRQMLTFARRQDLRPETVNPNAILLDFELLARRAVNETIDIAFTLHPALHPVRIDPGEFEAAVLNLVVNARDAVQSQGGQIAVTTRNVTRPEMPAKDGIPGLAGGSYIVVAVTDNGVGMDAATRAQMFEPFFTTKEFGRGSGLGLSQVHGFAHAAGGTVEIASLPGHGTTVEIWLPRADSAPAPVSAIAAARTSLAAVPRRATAGETVLAVEDDPDVLSAVVENLADLGYQVVAARDAAEALDLLRGQSAFDVLFSDIVMPGGMNGVELAAEAGRVRPGLRVLLTSGYTNDVLTGEHRIPANISILTKPYRRAELAEHLQTTLRMVG